MLSEWRRLQFILVKREALDKRIGRISVTEPYHRTGGSRRLRVDEGGKAQRRVAGTRKIQPQHTEQVETAEELCRHLYRQWVGFK